MTPETATKHARRYLDDAGIPLTPQRVGNLARALMTLPAPARRRLRIVTSARGPAGNRRAFGEVAWRKDYCQYLGRTGNDRLVWADWS